MKIPVRPGTGTSDCRRPRFGLLVADPSEHPRVHPVPLPVGACWLNFQEGWWRLLRKEAFAGQTFADYTEIERAVTGATDRLNHRATPWVWGRSPPSPRHRRRTFTYRL